jgi:hypothetical protein
MLCHPCETFLGHFLASDFTTWKRIRDVEEKWFTFKLGGYAAVEAAALAGCELCALFNRVRNESIPNYVGLGEKWHAQPASIDVKHTYGADGPGSKWTFQLLTVAPEMSWIPFEIFKPESGEPADSETFDWPLDVSTCPTSSKSIDIAKQWVQDCLHMHPQCSRADDMPLPTRVVDVGPESEAASPRLLVTRGRSGKYVTLSHCWGTSYRVTLTKNNLPKFEEAILLNKLPKTFQDAIQLTRLLGVQYLWIDALCIVQDDQNDWKRESAAMCSVFENAIFSISAVVASDSHSGVLHERSPHSVQVEVNAMQVGVRQKLDSLPEAMARSRLETRGWCYQERLLPKGILHVAPAQMYWECATHTASETRPSGEPSGQTATSHTSVAKQASCSSRSNPVSFCREWLHLVSVYSARQVTRPSDRLPAIAGLADKAQKENVDSHYLQGLWSYDLHAGLLWKRKLLAHGKLIPSRDKYFARSSTSSTERPRRPIARSWSWASTNDAVEFPTIGVYNARSPSHFDAKFLIPEAHEDGETVPPNMILPLEALVKRGTCRFSSQASRNPDEALFKPSGSLLVDDGLKCILDYVDEPVAKNCYGIRIANWKKLVQSRKRMQPTSLNKHFSCY